jgi:ABC-type branched-subunit amino acid transport system ATPase component
MALLEIDDIHVFYDNIEALKGISINVETKQIVALVGANGAGKTTTCGLSADCFVPIPAISASTEKASAIYAPMRSPPWACFTCRRGGASSPA